MDKLPPNIQLLIASAWVDDYLDPAEAALLRQILQTIGTSAEDIERCLKSPHPAIDQLLSSLTQAQQAEAIMRDVLRIVFVDGVLEIQEYDLIERVAKGLGLDEVQLDGLRQQVLLEQG